jgi:hypothetical protein
MFHTAHYNPTVVCTAMGGAMNVVNTSGKASRAVKESLAIGENSGGIGGGDHAIEVIVRDDFNQPIGAAGQSDLYRKNLVRSVAASALAARGRNRDAANHDIVHRMRGRFIEKVGELAIDLGTATRGNRNIVGGECKCRE